MKGALGNLMRQAQQMQEKVQQLQEELANLEVTGEAGAGLVKVTLNGKHQAKRVEISPELADEDGEMVGDLVAAAINDAVRRVEETTREKMAEATGGLQIPPGMNLPM